MKKIIPSIMAIALTGSILVGCGKTESPVESTIPETTLSNVETSIPEEVTVQAESSDEEIEIPALDTDEHFLTVEITFPASMFEDEDMSTFDPKAYAEENGFISAKVNDDGSVLVKMTKTKHKELLKETSDSLEESFSEFVEAEDTPYIKAIKHNDDFSRVDISVVRAEYENSFDMTPFSVGIASLMYQMCIDMEYHVEVNIIDADTEDVLDTVVFPDAFNDIGE